MNLQSTLLQQDKSRGKKVTHKPKPKTFQPRVALDYESSWHLKPDIFREYKKYVLMFCNCLLKQNANRLLLIPFLFVSFKTVSFC